MLHPQALPKNYLGLEPWALGLRDVTGKCFVLFLSFLI